MNELTTAAPRQTFDLSPQTFDQALTFSQYLADSDMVPKDFKGKPETASLRCSGVRSLASSRCRPCRTWR